MYVRPYCDDNINIIYVCICIFLMWGCMYVHSMCLCTCVVFTYVCVRMYDDNIKAANNTRLCIF
jgi:hypothetical protein